MAFVSCCCVAEGGQTIEDFPEEPDNSTPSKFPAPGLSAQGLEKARDPKEPTPEESGEGYVNGPHDILLGPVLFKPGEDNKLKLLRSKKEGIVVVGAVNEGPWTQWNTKTPGAQLQPTDQILEVNGTTIDELILRELGVSKDDRKVSMTVMRGVENTVRIQMDENTPLGLGFALVDKDHLFVTIISDGLISEWNKAHPDATVRETDMVTEVNGVKGDSKKLIIELNKVEKEKNIVLITHPAA